MINFDASILNYFFNAGLVVKIVMLILIMASIFSWTFILQRRAYFKSLQRADANFKKQFLQNDNLMRLYQRVELDDNDLGLANIFRAGFQEYLALKEQVTFNTDRIIDSTQRAMRAAQIHLQEQFENKLSFLAIVGTTSPYIGLFGTVWGIMQSLRALASNTQQASISMVAPGIAEALVATALGLFAAIPAVIAYNRYVARSNQCLNRLEAFQEELTNTLLRDAQK